MAAPFTAAAAIARSGRRWTGRIVIDAMNAIDFPSFAPTDLGGRPSSELIAEQFHGARVVKAFNHLDAQVFTNLDVANGQRVFFLAGDDPAAKAEIAKLIGQLDLVSIDLGPLDTGGRLIELPFGPLSIINLVKI